MLNVCLPPWLGLKHRRWVKFLILMLLGILLLGLPGQMLPRSAQAQTPQPDLTQPDLTQPDSTKPAVIKTIENLAPPEIQALLQNAGSSLSSAPVWLDGQTLFYVAAPTLAAPTAAGALSARQRAKEIEARLHQILRHSPDPTNLKVTWKPEPNSKQPLIYINDTFLMTVTYSDAQLRGHEGLKPRAEELTQTLRLSLERHQHQRQPAYLWRQAQVLALVIVLTGCLQFGLSRLCRRLNRQRTALIQTVTSPEAEALNRTTPRPTTALQQLVQLRRKKSWIDLKRMVLRLLQVILWIGSLYLCLGLFPYSRWLQSVLLTSLQLPIKLGVLVIITYWLYRLGMVWVDHLAMVLQEGTSLAQPRSERLTLRFSTFNQVIKSILGFLLLLIAVTIGLTLLGVRVEPLLTGAGLVGLAISLASQNLIQDVLNGFLILLEDQFSVGDVIVVNQVWGFVEAMTLRITQLRNEEGRLITIPNSKIGVVQNLSKEWSRVDLMIPVAPGTDINRALNLVEQVAVDMRQESLWGQLMLEPPLLLGVDRLDHLGATIRLWIKTRPLKQWDVAREYRRRLIMAFPEAGIAIGVPQQLIHISSPWPPVSHPDQPFTGPEATALPGNQEGTRPESQVNRDMAGSI